MTMSTVLLLQALGYFVKDLNRSDPSSPWMAGVSQSKRCDLRCELSFRLHRRRQSLGYL